MCTTVRSLTTGTNGVTTPVTTRCQAPADLVTMDLPFSLQYSIRKPQLPRLAQQQRAIQLGHLPDVIPQQGNPLQLAQILPAIHPKLPRNRNLLPNTGNNRESCAARKHGNIAIDRPCCAATYCAITLVLRKLALAPGTTFARYSSSELNARSST